MNSFRKNVLLKVNVYLSSTAAVLVVLVEILTNHLLWEQCSVNCLYWSTVENSTGCAWSHLHVLQMFTKLCIWLEETTWQTWLTVSLDDLHRLDKTSHWTVLLNWTLWCMVLGASMMFAVNDETFGTLSCIYNSNPYKLMWCGSVGHSIGESRSVFVLPVQLRAQLTSVLLDQLPVLCDLQRYLEHLAVMDPPPVKSDLILEQVCCITHSHQLRGKHSRN